MLRIWMTSSSDSGVKTNKDSSPDMKSTEIFSNFRIWTPANCYEIHTKLGCGVLFAYIHLPVNHIMSKTKSEYEQINLLVQSLSYGEDEKSYTYVTIDGFKAFKIACPICSPDSKRKNAKIFPKRKEDWKGNYPKQWFYLCHGKNDCPCHGYHSLNYFVSNYMGEMN